MGNFDLEINQNKIKILYELMMIIYYHEKNHFNINIKK